MGCLARLSSCVLIAETERDVRSRATPTEKHSRKQKIPGSTQPTQSRKLYIIKVSILYFMIDESSDVPEIMSRKTKQKKKT